MLKERQGCLSGVSENCLFRRVEGLDFFEGLDR